MNNNRVVVDIDGVLADFEGAFCLEYGHDNRERVSLEERYPNKATSIRKFINDPFVYTHLNPIQLGLDIVEWLNENNYEVSIVTARPFGFDGVTRAWLSRHGVKFSSYVSDIPKTGRIVNMKPLCAVDDLFSVQQALSKHFIPTIIVAQPWNRYIAEDMQRIETLDQFIESFEYICERI